MSLQFQNNTIGYFMPDELSIQDGDRIISGRFCFRSRRTVQVEITNALYPFRMTTTMYVVESRSPGGLLGDEGITVGRAQLRHLDRLCRHLEKNRAACLAGYHDFFTIVEKLKFSNGLSDFLFDAICEELEAERREGGMDQKEYEERIAEADMRKGQYHRAYRSIRKEFFARIIPFTMDADLEDQVLAWLRWNDVDGRREMVQLSHS